MIFSERFTIQFIFGFVVLILVAPLAHAAPAKKHLQLVTLTGSKAFVPSTIDRQTMKDARIAFEKKDYKKSIALYSKIPSASDYWSEALEERAWSHVHLNEHEQALSLVKTLLTPPVSFEITGEPYLLSALVQLRLCDYDELFKVMKKFKADIRPRYEAMKTLAKSGESEVATKFLVRATEMGQISRTAAGPDLPLLPRMVYRDHKLQEAFKASLKPGSSDRHARIVTLRLKSLAERDVKETDSILRKFHLIEVEAVGRMYSDVHLAGGKKSAPEVEMDANKLSFPDDEKDVWLDELDNYHVKAKGCPAPSGTTASAVSKGPKS